MKRESCTLRMLQGPDIKTTIICLDGNVYSLALPAILWFSGLHDVLENAFPNWVVCAYDSGAVYNPEYMYSVYNPDHVA